MGKATTVVSQNFDKVSGFGHASNAGNNECLTFDTKAWNRVINISREQEINQKKELFEVTGEGFFQEDISSTF